MSSLLATSVRSRFAGLVTSTREKMGTSLALSARLGTKGTKVRGIVPSNIFPGFGYRKFYLI